MQVFALFIMVIAERKKGGGGLNARH